MKLNKHQQIIKECFWDLDVSDLDIEHILYAGSLKEKQFLFSKILLNSSNLLQDLKLFSKQELECFLDDFVVPSFNRDFAFRRKNMAEVYFLDRPLEIDELKWIA